MPRYKKIYEESAVAYDLLVSREDFQGNIIKAIEEFKMLSAIDVAEMGAGTGCLDLRPCPLFVEFRLPNMPACVEKNPQIRTKTSIFFKL
jgi:hypothetical protein